MKLYDTGVYLQNGQEIIPENQANLPVAKEEAARNTIAYSILKAHNKSDNMEKLQIKFDKLTSHDITFVGIIQTARASGLEKFPVPYVLTNCHNSLCAVGGTINEDDHMFGLTCAKKYGGVYVPPHQAVIHQFAREMLAGGGKMILGSDSHTRYGALGTMAMGEGGPELVKQLLCQTYDINMPGVVAIYLKGAPRPGVGVTWVERHCDHWFDLTEVDLYTAVIVCNVARFQFFVILRSSVDRIEFLDLRICLPDGGKTCGFCCHNINTDTEICA